MAPESDDAESVDPNGRTLRPDEPADPGFVKYQCEFFVIYRSLHYRRGDYCQFSDDDEQPPSSHFVKAPQ